MSDVLRVHLSRKSTLPSNALPGILEELNLARRTCMSLGLLEMVRDQKIAVAFADPVETNLGEDIWIESVHERVDSGPVRSLNDSWLRF